MTIPRYAQAAAIVRARIAAGSLRPGEPAPSGAELARITGYAHLTCRRALRTLIADGTLTAGPSPNARPRVAAPGRPAAAADDAARALSAGLAASRHAADLTQTDLAALVGRSVTSVGHAETGRTWQSRQFWENADKALNARGELLRLHDAYRAAIAADPALAPDPRQPTDRTAAVIIPTPASLDDQDPVVLNLLRLAVEAMIAHPEAVPADLLSLLDAYAADLYGTLSPRPRRAVAADA
jgi:hypothetical protein